MFLTDSVRQKRTIRCFSPSNHIEKLHAYLQALITLNRKNGAAESAVRTCFVDRALARGMAASGTAAGKRKRPARFRLQISELAATTLVVTVVMYRAW